MTMKKIFISWAMGAFTLWSFIFFIANAHGRTVLELAGILMIVVIINLGFFAITYVGEC